MAKRPYAALGTFSTSRGTVIIRRLFARKQGTWVLILDGAHEALRLLLPDWRPRSPGTRTSLTPPTRVTTKSGIAAFYQSLVSVWLDRAQEKSAPVAPALSVPTYRTLGELMRIVDDEATIALRTGSIITYRHQWTTVLRAIPASTQLSSLTRERLQALMGELGATYASTTVRNLRAALSKLLLRAVEDGVLARNPLNKVKTPTPVVRPRRFLSHAQRDAVLSEAARRDRPVHLLFALLLHLGLRKSEALALRWEQVDLTERVVHICNSESFTTKSGGNRVVPICDELMEVIGRQTARSGFVLHPDKPVSRGRYRWNYARVFTSVVRAAGVSWMTPHCCRHTFASLFLAGDGGFFKLAAYLGHSIPETTQLYAHVAPGYDRDINRLGSKQSARHRA